MTSFAKSASNLLAARDNRQEALERVLRSGQPAVVLSVLFLSLNIPGADKHLPGVEHLFSALRKAIAAEFSVQTEIEQADDALGPYALYQLHLPAAEVKRRCVTIEAAVPAFRLADLDVYAGDGQQVGRAEIDLPRRACLLCSQPAVDCMRVKRHDFAALVAHVHELLTPYRS